MALFKSPEQKQAEDAARAERAFWESPQGQARLAYQRGDEVFQLVTPLSQQKAVIAPMLGSATPTTVKDISAELNDVVREGWSLVNGTAVFVETGSESRDKFMMSGQQVAVTGSVMGYYLFSRRA